MVNPADFFNLLKTQSVGFFTGVPDSLLKDFCAYVDDYGGEQDHLIAVNEGAAVAIAAGHHLATGGVPLVYMQNSGLGNAVNPLVSLADAEVDQIPMLLLVGWRGEPDVKDEPQHIKMGKITTRLLEALEIPYVVLSNSLEEVSAEVSTAIKTAREKNMPYALVVRKDTFSAYASVHAKKETYRLTREQAVAEILPLVGVDSVVVSTTGKLSRELFELRKQRNEGHMRDFLTVGSMGHASQIALGAAQATSKRVYCFDGDGAALMHLGGMATIGARAPKNFIHVVFNNGMHESVGGQATVAFKTDLCEVAHACGYKKVLRVDNRDGIQSIFKGSEHEEGPVFIEVRISGGSRDDLGRPTRSPVENKQDFEKFLKS